MMWIAKPIIQTSTSELQEWEQVPDRPLAQTLAWARAIESVQGKTYLIFNPEERVGGIVFETSKGIFECVNGPILAWDDVKNAPRQFATFALAVSKLTPQFHSLHLSPRWTESNASNRLKNLPIPPTEEVRAATLILPLHASKEHQFKNLTQRMQRTLKTSWNEGITVRWETLSPSALEKFTQALHPFSQSHFFTTPPLKWFQALTSSLPFQTAFTPSFWLVTSEKQESPQKLSQTQLLICKMGNQAHYLFGYENRIPGLRSAISTSATAHWEALTQCASMGIQAYDFNGYLPDPHPDDPYFGVCQFKKQFAGKIVQYVVPKFRIQ